MLRPYFSHTMHANDRALNFVPYSVNGLCDNGLCTIFAIGLCAMILIGLCAGFVNGLCAILFMDIVLSDLVPILEMCIFKGQLSIPPSIIAPIKLGSQICKLQKCWYLCFAAQVAFFKKSISVTCSESHEI